jgi:hypothetical protein
MATWNWVAVSVRRNNLQLFADQAKYKNLSTEIKEMWNIYYFVTPVTIGATANENEQLTNICK